MVPRGDKITLNEESEEYRWLPASQVERLEASENTKSIAKKFARSEKQSLR